VTRYPSFEEVLAAHARLIELFGGAKGVRDRGALEAAVARPRAGHYKDVVEESAALLESLSQNHPFIDGNKRTAVTVAAAFLRLNGYVLELEDDEAYRFIAHLYDTGDFRFGRIEAWLRTHSKLAR
jgi:death on curing protein